MPIVLHRGDLLPKNSGKKLESDIENSCSTQNIFYFRVRDVDPTAIKKGKSVPKNKFDCIVFHNGYLFPLELKSVKAKSISMQESMIKDYQIKSLTTAAEFKDVIPGFIFNFRLEKEKQNKAYFVHIKDFNAYRNIAENQLDHNYKSKINKSSIPIGICEEVGIELTNVKLRTNYRYYIKQLLDELIQKYS